jgi:hypothetical protein
LPLEAKGSAKLITINVRAFRRVRVLIVPKNTNVGTALEIFGGIA